MLIVGLTSLVVCLILNFGYFPRTTVFPDENRFLESARHLILVGEFASSGGRAWEMPGTALFFAPFIAIFNTHAILAIRCAQALMLLVQSALIGWIAWRLFANRVTALLAMALSALYPFFLFYQGLLLSEPLFNLLLVVSYAGILFWQGRGCRIDGALLLTCLSFAAATYVKATLTFLPPLLIALVPFAAGLSLRRTIRVLALAMLIFSACLAPWWLRNYETLGRFVPFTTSAAQNLYLGNNSHNLDGGNDWATDAEPEVVARIHAISGEVERQHAYFAAAFAFIRGRPRDALRLAGWKLVRFWSIVPNAKSFSSMVFRFVSVASFGPVLVFALICAARRFAKIEMVLPLYALIAYFTLLHTLTIASLRYRLPLEPFLIALAAEPLRRLAEQLWRAVRQQGAAPAALDRPIT